MGVQRTRGVLPHSEHQSLSRIAAKRSALKLFCPTHQRVEEVTDLFQVNGGTAVLACGCRRLIEPRRTA